MFDTLTDRLQGFIKTVRGEAKLTPENIEEAIREVRKSLLEADVSLKVVKLFISRVRQRALGIEVIESVSPGQQFIKVVHDELVTIFGGENVPINLKGEPAVVMLLGLQGSGKTTACAKLALKLKKEGKKPLMVACDIQRPAAIMQLETLGKQIEVPVFTLPGVTDVTEIATKAIGKAKDEGLSPVLLDTAGRLQIDTDLMAELVIIDRLLEPGEKLLVIDSMTGQEAVTVADTFNTQLDTTGVLLTKVDGDARGGAALSVREATGRPIKFISTGEKLADLEAFYPERMASRILGMGDVLSLVEKAQGAIDEKEAEKVAKQMMAGEFTLEMFVNAQRMMKKMGSFGDIMKMMGIGGMMGISSDQQSQLADHGEKMLSLYETAINSMTPEERRKPEIINMSRRRRIANGAGMAENNLGQMLNEFDKMRQMFQQLNKMMGAGGASMLSGLIPGMPGAPGAAKGQMPPFPASPTMGMPKLPPAGFPRKSGFSGGYRKKGKRF